jgi:hypothetical protein
MTGDEWLTSQVPEEPLVEGIVRDGVDETAEPITDEDARESRIRIHPNRVISFGLEE